MGVDEWGTPILGSMLHSRQGNPLVSGCPQPPNHQTFWRSKDTRVGLSGILLARPSENHNRIHQILCKLHPSQRTLPQTIQETETTPNPIPPVVLNIHGFH